MTDVHKRAIAEAEAQLERHKWRYDDTEECPCELCSRAKDFLAVLATKEEA